MLNPADDVLYRIHREQASRQGQNPLAYEEFTRRTKGLADTDLSGLLAAPKVDVATPTPQTPQFDLGRLCITPNAAHAIPQEDVAAALTRHLKGDWGTLDAEDRAVNDQALAQGGRLVSAYVAKNGVKFWIITEADRSVTTVLLPEDY